MQSQLDFLRSQMYLAASRGWNKTSVSATLQLNLDGEWKFDECYFRPQAEAADGETEEAGSIYFSLYSVQDAEQQASAAERILHRAPDLTSFKTKKLLELVSEVQKLGDDLKLPADFINPLILMAEQLRTNILEDRRPAVGPGYVIRNSDFDLYWDKTAGWTDRASAWVFTTEERAVTELPRGGAWLLNLEQLNDEIPF